MAGEDGNDSGPLAGRFDRRLFLQTTAGLGVGSVVGLDGIESASASGGDVLWEFTTKNWVSSSPTVVDETVYIGSADERVYAIDAVSGESEWFVETNDIVFGSPNVKDGTVYVGEGHWSTRNQSEAASFQGSAVPQRSIDTSLSPDAEQRAVYALDAATGEQEWKVLTDDSVQSSPTVIDGTVYVGSFDGRLYAIDADDGTVNWTFETDAPVRASPVVANGTVYIGNDNGVVIAVDGSTGDLEWQYQSSGLVGAAVTYAEDTIFFGSIDSESEGNVYGLDADGGSEKWAFGTNEPVISAPAVHGDTVFVGTGVGGGEAGTMYALDRANGDVRWEFPAEGPLNSSPTVAGNTVFVGDLTEFLFALQADSGEVEWAFDGAPIVSSPTIVDGTVFFGRSDDAVFALDAGVDGSSEDARINSGALGHHHVWANDEWSGGNGVTFDITPQNPTIGDEITFDAADTSGAVEEFEWAFGDGTTATGEVVTHSYDQAGTYEVTLTVQRPDETDTETESLSVADETDGTVIYERDFESVDAGTVPSDFVLVGNNDQGVTNNDAVSGGQSYYMSGTHGGCWMAIARFPEAADLSFTDNMVFSGSFKRVAGSEGCHSHSGRIRLSTNASSSEFDGNRQGLLTFDPDGTVTAAGETVGDYDDGEWVSFEVEYDRNREEGAVTYHCQIDGGETTSVTREARDTEDELSAIQLQSDDFTVLWDDVSVVEADDPSDPGTVAFEITPPAPTVDEEITFDAADTTGTVEEFEWAFGDGGTATGEAVTHSYDQPGTYEVTLTVQRPESSETASKQLDVAEEDDQGDGGITAAFEYGPEFPEPGQTVSFDANPSSGSISEYVWEFDDGSTADGVTATHSYEEPGEYEVELRALTVPESAARIVGENGHLVVPDEVEDGGETTAEDPVVADKATATILVETEDETVTGFTVSDTEPFTYETVQFDTGIGQEAAEDAGLTLSWSFGDGATAEGVTVGHEYTAPGTYTVELSTDGETFEKTVKVQEPPIEVTDVGREIGGTLLPNLGVDETVEASVQTAGNQDLDRVEFEFAGQQTEDSGPPYDASFTIGELDTPGTPLTVRAVGSNGAVREVTREIPVHELPDWLVYVLEADSIVIDSPAGTDDDEFTLTYSPLDNLDVGFTVPENVLGGDDGTSADGDGDYDFGVGFGGIYNPLTARAEVTASGSVAGEVLAVGFDLQVSVTGTVNTNTLELAGAEAGINSQLEFDIEPPTVPVPLSIPIPGTSSSIGIVPTVVVEADGTFNFDGELAFQDGTVKPGVALNVTLGITLQIPGLPAGELIGEPSGGIEGSFDLGTEDWNLSATLFLAGKIVLNPPLLPGIELEVDPIWEEPIVDNGALHSDAWDSTDATVRHRSPGGTQPLPEIESVDAVGPLPQDVSPRESFRLSDRPYDDIDPSIATPTDDQTLVVWTQQPDDGSETGHDVVGRWFENGEWGETVAITDDSQSHAAPVCAATDTGEILLAWRQLDTSESQIETVQDAQESLDDAQIGFSIYDGSSWSEPATLTSSDLVDRRPTVAPDDDGWLLAYERYDRETGATTVHSVTVSTDGTVDDIEQRDGAASPDAGWRNDDGVDLAYLSLDAGGAVDAVVHEHRTGDAVSTETYQASGADDTVVAGGRVIWTTDSNRNPRLFEGSDGSSTELTVREEVAEMRELALTVSGGGEALLSYLTPLDGGDRKLAYRLDRGDGWIYDRPLAGSDAKDLRLRYTDATFAGPGSIMSAYAVRGPGFETVSDVFATLQSFGPAYDLDAEVDDGVAGEQTTLTYTLANRGDIGGTAPVTVTVSQGETAVESVTHDPLDSGDSLTQELSVTIGETGEFTIAVDVPEPSLETEQRQVDLRAARPDLRVAEISADRTGPHEAVVRTTIANDGGAVATDVPIELSDASGAVAGPTLGEVGPESTAQVEATIDPRELDNSDTHRIRIDPGETLPGANTESARQTYLVRPNVRVDDIRFREDDQRFVRVLLANAGPADGIGTLTVRDGDGSVLAETSVKLPPATTVDGEQTTAYRQVDMQTPGITQGQTVSATVDPTVSDLDPESLTHTSTVEAIVPGEFKESPVQGPPIFGNAPARDLDGDDLYEDIDGDGTLTVSDVQLLFENRNTAAIQSNAEMFNFDGDDAGEVTLDDVRALLKLLLEQHDATGKLAELDPATLDADKLAILFGK
jgi:outer membrane protein assembly factor BamB/PKD repeat protein